MIGKENTVPAFGFAFFEPLKARAFPVMLSNVYNMNNMGILRSGVRGITGAVGSQGARGPTKGFSGVRSFSGRNMRYGSSIGGQSVNSGNTDMMYRPDDVQITCSVAPSSSNSSQNALTASPEPEEKTCGPIMAAMAAVSVGAGSEITQDLKQDDLGVADWKDKPSQVIRLYFVFKEQFKNILKNGGVKNLAGDKAGYLKKVPVG